MATEPQELPISPPLRLVIGISGASGVIYGIRILQHLRNTPIETHLIMTKAAVTTLAYETDLKRKDIEALADVVHSNENIGAGPASGSFRALGMIVAPCSMKSLAEIATGLGSSLLARAADVTLKERRRLVLMTRETPLTLGHLKAMQAVTEMGGVIAPPVPAFYTRPENLDEMVDHTVGRAMDLFDIEVPGVKRWREPDGS